MLVGEDVSALEVADQGVGLSTVAREGDDASGVVGDVEAVRGHVRLGGGLGVKVLEPLSHAHAHGRGVSASEGRGELGIGVGHHDGWNERGG